MPEQRINWENVATDFLRYIAEAKAEAWDEGFNASENKVMDTPNPYREDA